MDDSDDSDNSANEGPDGSGIKILVEDYADAASHANSADLPQNEGGLEPSQGTFVQNKPILSRKRPDRGIHSRGLPDSKIELKDPVQACQRSRVEVLVWSDTEDLVHAVLSRERWTQDITSPSKQASSSGCGGIGYFFSLTEERRLKEATTGWDWYYKQGGQE
ncbi:hypothetical protein MMC06_004036 [Schaereria dolodes]|nr:hypothetical protein [Schaereria dolodes]